MKTFRFFIFGCIAMVSLCIATETAQSHGEHGDNPVANHSISERHIHTMWHTHTYSGSEVTKKHAHEVRHTHSHDHFHLLHADRLTNGEGEKKSGSTKGPYAYKNHSFDETNRDLGGHSAPTRFTEPPLDIYYETQERAHRHDAFGYVFEYGQSSGHSHPIVFKKPRLSGSAGPGGTTGYDIEHHHHSHGGIEHYHENGASSHNHDDGRDAYQYLKRIPSQPIRDVAPQGSEGGGSVIGAILQPATAQTPPATQNPSPQPSTTQNPSTAPEVDGVITTPVQQSAPQDSDPIPQQEVTPLPAEPQVSRDPVKAKRVVPLHPLQVTEYMLRDYIHLVGRKFPQWIELYNPNDESVPLGGYQFTHAHRKFSNYPWEYTTETIPEEQNGEKLEIPARSAFIIANKSARNQYGKPGKSGIKEGQIWIIPKYGKNKRYAGLKNGWHIADKEGKEVYRAGLAFELKNEDAKWDDSGDWKGRFHLPPHNPDGHRVSYQFPPSEEPEVDHYYGNQNDKGAIAVITDEVLTYDVIGKSSPGFYKSKAVAPGAPSLIKPKTAVLWGSLKLPTSEKLRNYGGKE